MTLRIYDLPMTDDAIDTKKRYPFAITFAFNLGEKLVGNTAKRFGPCHLLVDTLQLRLVGRVGSGGKQLLGIIALSPGIL